MTQREKFFETVGILVEAYLNGTLLHGDCAACAVGNIIAAKLGCKIVTRVSIFDNEIYFWHNGNTEISPVWSNVFYTDSRGVQNYHPWNYGGGIKLQIESSGYSLMDLAKIEHAFERDTRYDGDGNVINEDEAMFTGLMSVVDTLAAIHGIDLTERESAKLLFNKAIV